MTVTLNAHIKPYILIEPASKVFLKGSYGEQVEREIIISSNDENLSEPFEITKVESDMDDKITYKVISAEEQGKFKLKVMKNPKLTVQNAFGSLFVYTNNDRAPRNVIQVQVTTKGEMVVRPSILNFGFVPEARKHNEESPVQRSLTISNSKHEFEIEDITFSIEGYRAKVDPIEDGKSYRVTVDFFPQSGGRNYIGQMVIHTSDPREPLVNVRLIARFR